MTPPPPQVPLPDHAGSASRRQLLATGAASVCLLGATSWTVRPVRKDPSDRVVKLQRVDPRAVPAVPTDAPFVALTFDDGPDPAYTPTVLDILDRFEVRATFFMIGRAAAAHPDLVRAVLRAGHEIGNHTQDHLWLDSLSVPKVRDQVEGGRATLSGLGVTANGLFRPPRGLTSPTVATVTATLRERSYFWGSCLEANVAHRSPLTGAANTASRVHAGAIVLAHDGGHLDGPNPQSIDRTRSVEALPALIGLTRAQGLDFMPLGQLTTRARLP